MAGISVGLIDQFHPAIAAAVTRVLPADWTIRLAASAAPADRAAALADAEVAFVVGAPVDAELLAAAPRLRLIQKLGAGIDKIDRAVCERRGIAIARLAGGNAIPVAEHAVMMMLAAMRRLPLIDRRTRAGAWDKEEARGINRHLHGKNVGIVGFGAIGRAVATLLGSFGVHLAYFDPVAAPAGVAAGLSVTRLDLDPLLEWADVVSLHLPLLPETRGLIGADRIARMKPGAILVNCARGGLVDEAALHAALVDGHLFAAALDTFAAEPPVGSPLLTHERTVVTPHLAGATVDNFEAVLRRAAANAADYLAGRGLPAADAAFIPPLARS
ncbi:D-3-phosphoglycerate dehydrogenase [Stella humosa]|uniref:D-3-phosphoglycerate dehydrogenase n=1 Tax=Stella humosa TaxID=94 RepID=A0A3N1KNK5_9PROT|nr:NAD(P)-dependent oxidoreductase [Stella humosa]ROP80822.1 D-3-phosphoglycerate dehydrogenase [Stella humosa]BBK33387.1 dehydrogenase [Stella humosa]